MHTSSEPQPTPTPYRRGHHVVVGAGPVGSTPARLLAAEGHEVVVVTRRGAGPEAAGVTRTALDATDVDALARVTEGAAAIYNCVNPPYHRWAVDWPSLHHAFLGAAERAGAVLVMMDNLYAFGPSAPMPLREDTPMAAQGRKGATRRAMATELLEAHAAGRLRATLARASDFYGPGVVDAMLGERVMPRVLAGRKVSLLGDLDAPHAFSYMPDVARTLVALATDERAWGRAWHVPNAPALSTRRTVAALADAAGTQVAVGRIPWTAVRALGLAVPAMRELQETRYQFDRPWLVDSTRTERTFGLTATPLDDAAAATVAWWRAR